MMKALETRGIREGGDDNHRVVRHRQLHDPGI